MNARQYILTIVAALVSRPVVAGADFSQEDLISPFYPVIAGVVVYTLIPFPLLWASRKLQAPRVWMRRYFAVILVGWVLFTFFVLSSKVELGIRQFPEIVKIVWLLAIPIILVAAPVGVVVLWLFVTSRK